MARTRHIALDARHGAAGFQIIAAGIHRHALADKAEALHRIRRARIAQHSEHRRVAAAVAHGEEGLQPQLVQGATVIALRLDRQTRALLRQRGGKPLRREQIGRAVHKTARAEDGLRQRPAELQVLLLPALAGGIAGKFRLPLIGERIFHLISAAADALGRSQKAVTAQLGRRAQVEHGALCTAGLHGLGRLAIDLLAGQDRPALAATHGDLLTAVRQDAVVQLQIVARLGRHAQADRLVVIALDHGSFSFSNIKYQKTRRKRSGSDCQKTCPAESFGGKKSVKD